MILLTQIKRENITNFSVKDDSIHTEKDFRKHMVRFQLNLYGFQELYNVPEKGT